jgi:hypothetical protein
VTGEDQPLPRERGRRNRPADEGSLRQNVLSSSSVRDMGRSAARPIHEPISQQTCWFWSRHHPVYTVLDEPAASKPIRL